MTWAGVWVTEDPQRGIALLRGRPMSIKAACEVAQIRPLWSGIGRGFVIDLGRVPDFAAGCDYHRIPYQYREAGS